MICSFTTVLWTDEGSFRAETGLHASLLISGLDCVSLVTHWVRLHFACFPLFIRGQFHSSHFLLPNIEKAKLKRWWTYLSQFRLKLHHIPGEKNELSDYISRNNVDALIRESSEALAKEAFRRMDVQLDPCMRTAGILEGRSSTDYQSQYKEILHTLSTGLEPRVIDGHQWYENNQYLIYEDRIVVPKARLDRCLQWSHHSSGHTGANRSVDFFC